MPSPFLKAKAPKISRIFEKDMAEAKKSDGKDVKAKAKTKDEKQKIKQTRKRMKKAIDQERSKARDEKDARTGEPVVSTKKETPQEKKIRKKSEKYQLKKENFIRFFNFLKASGYELYSPETNCFSNMDEAASAFGMCVFNKINPKFDNSGPLIDGDNCEYGGRIYEYEGKFYFTIPYTDGKINIVSHKPPDEFLSAYAHTHAWNVVVYLEPKKMGDSAQKHRAAKADMEQFSLEDRTFSFNQKKVLFLSYNDKDRSIVVTKKIKPGNNLMATLLIEEDTVSCVKI